MPTHGRSTAVPPSWAMGRSSARSSFTAASTAWLGMREARQHDAHLLVGERRDAVLGAQRLAQALEHQRHGGGRRRAAQQRLQPVDAAQLDHQHRKAPVGGARDRGLAVEEAQQLLARARLGGRDLGSGGWGRTRGPQAR